MSTIEGRLLILLLLLAGSSHSKTVPDQNVRTAFKVINVNKDDSLNVRQEPDASAPVVCRLAATTTGIEVIDTVKSKKWWKIRYMGNTGYVNRSFLIQKIDSGFNKKLSCLGTEPFWNLSINSNQIILNNPIDHMRTYTITKMEQSMNSTVKWFIEGIASNGEKLAIYLSEGTCSDDMSDTRYRYQVFIYDSAKSTAISGCCNEQ